MTSSFPFYKYHALGNDYIVLDPAEVDEALTEEAVRLICHRNFGVGSDGILLGPVQNPQGEISLIIFNPDGSQAEKKRQWPAYFHALSVGQRLDRELSRLYKNCRWSS